MSCTFRPVTANLLLEHDGQLYIPVQAAPPEPPRMRRSRSNAFSDSMNLDDTRDRIYIHNLDEELADVESDEEKLIFLPDIERRLNRIPKSVLSTPDDTSKIGNEVVLYSVPTSISIPEEQDNVRKAIIESRQRAREHALEAEALRLKNNNNCVTEQSARLASASLEDPDAMDMS